MTREQAKELLPIITAYAEGEDIQVWISRENRWQDLTFAMFNSDPSHYRIKPKTEEAEQ